MKRTLNQLALASFYRKARKINKNINVLNLTSHDVDVERILFKGESLILWNEEHGFSLIDVKENQKLAYVVSFPDKYADEEVFYYGILNSEGAELAIYRCYEQLTFRDGPHVFGLKFLIGEFKVEQEFHYQQDREQVLLEQGRGSWLSS
jgi:hypothetical protein